MHQFFQSMMPPRSVAPWGRRSTDLRRLPNELDAIHIALCGVLVNVSIALTRSNQGLSSSQSWGELRKLASGEAWACMLLLIAVMGITSISLSCKSLQKVSACLLSTMIGVLGLSQIGEFVDSGVFTSAILNYVIYSALGYYELVIRIRN